MKSNVKTLFPIERKNVMVSKQTKKCNWPISMEIQKLKKEILSVSCSLLLLLIMIHPVLTVKTEWDMKKIYYIHHYIILQNVLYTCIYRSAISTCMIKIQSYEELKALRVFQIFFCTNGLAMVYTLKCGIQLSCFFSQYSSVVIENSTDRHINRIHVSFSWNKSSTNTKIVSVIYFSSVAFIRN